MRLPSILCLFLSAVSLFSQELPPIQNYAPSDYQAENQNWAISQSKDKLLYIANSKGLLEFNGAKWKLFPSPNETIMRSVKVVEDRIYTGCYMEFGYWIRNGFGQLEYTSLSKKIAEKLIQDEEFWGIFHMDSWILFQSLNRIYVYNTVDDSFHIIDSETNLFRMFKVGESIYFQKSDKGIFRIENGMPILAYDDGPAVKDEIINIFQRENDILLISRNNGLFSAHDGEIAKWESSLDSLSPKISTYSAIQLEDNSFALGTISNGVILLDENGQLIQHIDQIKGLRNNTVLSLMEDLDHNIWLGLDNGVSYLDLKSPIRVYYDNKGVVGSIYASIVKNDMLYLGTNQGLFYKPINSSKDFRLIKGTQGQVWSLKIIGETLFCCHHRGTFIVEEGNARRVANVEGTWKIGRVPGKPNLLLQGNYDGLYILEQIGDEWRLRNKIEGFENSSRFFEILGDKVFVNHEYKGIFSMEVDPDYIKASNVNIDTTFRGFNTGIAKYNGNLLYAYKKGVLKYDENSNTFIKDSILSNVFTENNYVSGKMILDERKGHLWIFTNDDIGIISQGKLANTPIIESIPLLEKMRGDIVGYENVTEFGDSGDYLIGSSSGYLIVDIEDVTEQEFEVNIDNVSKTNKENNTKTFVKKDAQGNFESHENNLEITFFAAEYNKYLNTNYQFQLQGIYDNWSNWSEESTATFENLPFGEYTFRVKAKIGDTISNNIATYSFKINRPWYLSNVFLALYVIGFVLGALLMHQAYRRHYHKKQRVLIEQNKKEMELARAQNEKEIVKIKNEQLQQEFKSKSNELAASTLSIIRKNELLSKVKEQLVSNVEDKESIKPIIRVIDKNLTQNDDWEMFKEAFNNADRKFLKKLKKAHPNLSPNDVRLCAYLRLNLSSKEIAPLLNISVRSVEIKRYRLRKKMELAHEDNLVDYILKL
ncbi:LuxR family transcriptional regulator [Muricauda sp. JGD-17]|uniref:LuxR family transcriptional regulator n=1 Tax=Flagellimonas ochracea TaxID=2696472 RepID=A0A964TCM2_9FLAO|nr:triple tyrosine motif-containing protein [Allomuricauda ochracea]NAY92400.1 LuxR family transcriptional regulator [Allomuricauda ochracea]